MAVDRAFFTTTPEIGAIALAWQTVGEADLLGFYLWRPTAQPAAPRRVCLPAAGKEPSAPPGVSPDP